MSVAEITYLMKKDKNISDHDGLMEDKFDKPKIYQDFKIYCVEMDVGGDEGEVSNINIVETYMYGGGSFLGILDNCENGGHLIENFHFKDSSERYTIEEVSQYVGEEF